MRELVVGGWGVVGRRRPMRAQQVAPLPRGGYAVARERAPPASALPRECK